MLTQGQYEALLPLLGQALEKMFEKVVPDEVDYYHCADGRYSEGWNDCIEQMVENVKKYAEGEV
jgi:hypothetical protein